MNSDLIRIDGLELRCRVGLRPAERRRRQRVVADIAVACDLRRAGRTDDVADTVDYEALCARIAGAVEPLSFALLEALAAAVAGACLQDQRVRRVAVAVWKRRALKGVRRVAVHISRARQGC